MKLESALEIVSKYHRFDDGLLELFSYVFLRDGSMTVNVELHARNHAVEGDVWRRVRIVVGGVGEVRSSFAGGETNVICSGVKLLEFDGAVCLDIDGEYGAREPSSMDDVRKYSPCYVVGETIEVIELE